MSAPGPWDIHAVGEIASLRVIAMAGLIVTYGIAFAIFMHRWNKRNGRPRRSTDGGWDSGSSDDGGFFGFGDGGGSDGGGHGGD